MSPVKHANKFNRFINLIRLLESLVVALRNFITLYYESFTSVFTVRLIIRKILWVQLASSNDYATGKKELYFGETVLWKKGYDIRRRVLPIVCSYLRVDRFALFLPCSRILCNHFDS